MFPLPLGIVRLRVRFVSTRSKCSKCLLTWIVFLIGFRSNIFPFALFLLFKASLPLASLSLLLGPVFLSCSQATHARWVLQCGRHLCTAWRSRLLFPQASSSCACAVGAKGLMLNAASAPARFFLSLLVCVSLKKTFSALCTTYVQHHVVARFLSSYYLSTSPILYTIMEKWW